MTQHYFIETPIGGGYDNLMPVEQDEHVKFIETVSTVDCDHVCLGIYWNKKYSEIPVDEKYPYKGAHCVTKMSVSEAIRLRDSLTRHTNRILMKMRGVQELSETEGYELTKDDKRILEQLKQLEVK